MWWWKKSNNNINQTLTRWEFRMWKKEICHYILMTAAMVMIIIIKKIFCCFCFLFSLFYKTVWKISHKNFHFTILMTLPKCVSLISGCVITTMIAIIIIIFVIVVVVLDSIKKFFNCKDISLCTGWFLVPMTFCVCVEKTLYIPT